MILNSYNLKKTLIMKKRKEEYINSTRIVPINNIYTLKSDFIKKQNEYVEEIKNVETKPKKKSKNKKGLPLVLDLSDLDMVEFPKLKDEKDEDIVIIDQVDDEGVKVDDEGVKVDDEVDDEVDGEGVKVDDEDVKVDGEDVKVDGEDVKVDGEDVKVDDEDVKVDDEGIKVEIEDIDDEPVKGSPKEEPVEKEEGDKEVKIKGGREDIDAELKGGNNNDIKKIVVTSFF